MYASALIVVYLAIGFCIPAALVLFAPFFLNLGIKKFTRSDSPWQRTLAASVIALIWYSSLVVFEYLDSGGFNGPFFLGISGMAFVICIGWMFMVSFFAFRLSMKRFLVMGTVSFLIWVIPSALILLLLGALGQNTDDESVMTGAFSIPGILAYGVLPLLVFTGKLPPWIQKLLPMPVEPDKKPGRPLGLKTIIAVNMIIGGIAVYGCCAALEKYLAGMFGDVRLQGLLLLGLTGLFGLLLLLCGIFLLKNMKFAGNMAVIVSGLGCVIALSAFWPLPEQYLRNITIQFYSLYSLYLLFCGWSIFYLLRRDL